MTACTLHRCEVVSLQNVSDNPHTCGKPASWHVARRDGGRRYGVCAEHAEMFAEFLRPIACCERQAS